MFIIESYVWLALIVVGVIIEAVTSQLVSIWFVFGFICGLIAYYLGAPVSVQIAVAVIVSLLSLVLTKTFFKNIIKSQDIPTNSDRHIGKEALVISDIGSFGEIGQVKIGGIIWTAVSQTNQIIPQNTKVIVKKIEGNKLYVEKLED